MVAHVVAVQTFPVLGATFTQLFSGTGVGPVVSAAGHSVVTQLFDALAVCARQLPGGTPMVNSPWLQIVVTLPLPGAAGAGVQA